MSAGKGDKWRTTDFKTYYNSPLWENLKKKKTLEKSKNVAIIIGDAKNVKVGQQ